MLKDFFGGQVCNHVWHKFPVWNNGDGESPVRLSICLSALHLFFCLNLSSDPSGARSFPLLDHLSYPLCAHSSSPILHKPHSSYICLDPLTQQPAFTFLSSLQHLDSILPTPPLPGAAPFNPSIQLLPYLLPFFSLLGRVNPYSSLLFISLNLYFYLSSLHLSSLFFEAIQMCITVLCPR